MIPGWLLFPVGFACFALGFMFAAVCSAATAPDDATDCNALQRTGSSDPGR